MDTDEIFETLQELFAAYVAYAPERQKMYCQRDAGVEARLKEAFTEFSRKVKEIAP